jgi:hypothetical protein
LSLHIFPPVCDQPGQLQQIFKPKPAPACGENYEGVFRFQISPTQRNLADTALLIVETHAVLQSVPGKSGYGELAAGQRMKWMCNAKSLCFDSINGCSSLWFSTTFSNKLV